MILTSVIRSTLSVAHTKVAILVSKLRPCLQKTLDSKRFRSSLLGQLLLRYHYRIKQSSFLQTKLYACDKRNVWNGIATNVKISPSCSNKQFAAIPVVVRIYKSRSTSIANQSGGSSIAFGIIQLDDFFKISCKISTRTASQSFSTTINIFLKIDVQISSP